MHIISGKLRRDANTKPTNNGSVHFIELAEVTKDNQGQKQYTNYRLALFAKSEAQNKFYNDTLRQGAFVVVQGDKIRIDTYQPDGGELRISLSLENARLVDSDTSNVGQQQQNQGYQKNQQRGFGQQQQNQPRTPANPPQNTVSGWGQLPQQQSNNFGGDPGFGDTPNF